MRIVQTVSIHLAGLARHFFAEKYGADFEFLLRKFESIESKRKTIVIGHQQTYNIEQHIHLLQQLIKLTIQLFTSVSIPQEGIG